MTKDRDYFGIFLNSVDRMARKDLVPFIPEIDLDPGGLEKIDLFRRLKDVGILGLSDGESGFSDMESIAQAVWKLSEYCAGIGAFASYCLASDMLLKNAGFDAPGRRACLCIFDDEELDLSPRVIEFRTRLRDGLVTGRKKSVVLGGLGGPYAVFASGCDGTVLCLVEHDPSTVVVEEVGLLGARALRVADVAFVNARPVAIEPVNRDSLIFIFSVLSLLTGACACATSAKALDTAREYARERYQGGRMIEDHDAIKLLIETNRAAIQSAWKGVLDSAAGFDQGSTDGIASCFRAKAAASRAAVNAGLDAIQVYGGYGYMRDYGVEKRFRDAAALSVLPLDSTRLLLLSSMLAG